MQLKSSVAALACGLLTSISAGAVTVPNYVATIFSPVYYSMVFDNVLSENGRYAFSAITGNVDGDATYTVFYTAGSGNTLSSIGPTGYDTTPSVRGINNYSALSLQGVPGVINGLGINNQGQQIVENLLVTPGGPATTILAPNSGQLLDLNDAGQVLGVQGNLTASSRGFVYSNGNIEYLSTGSYKQAFGQHISSNGFVAGSVVSGNTSAGAVWMNGELTVIQGMYTRDVNRWGMVAGDNEYGAGTLWVDGTFYNLNDLLVNSLPAGYRVERVEGINDKGQIAAQACNYWGDCQAMRLDPTTPVPEPEMYAMLLGGLGVAGYAARRRRHSERKKLKVKTLIATACALLAGASASAAVPNFAVTLFKTDPFSYYVAGGALSENGSVFFSGITGFADGDAIYTTFKSTGAGNETQIVGATSYFVRPAGINNAGTVVMSTTNLPPDARYGNGINNLGQVVDSTSLITPGAAPVKILNANAGTLVDVNDAGQVIGNLGYDAHGAFIYSNGTFQTLSSGSYSKATATHISSNGYVAGLVSTGSNTAGAVWMDGNLQVLDMVKAVDINRWGVAVGQSSLDQYDTEGLLWVNGKTYKLNDLLGALPAEYADLRITNVSGINDKGQILAEASYNGWDYVMVRLDPTSPVPEPETYAMLLAGLGVAGYAARRRRAAAKAS